MKKVENEFKLKLFKEDFLYDFFANPVIMDQHHWHNHIEFNYLYSGELLYEFNGQKFTLKQDKFVMFWAGIPHKTLKIKKQKNKNCNLFNIYFPIDSFLMWLVNEDLKKQILSGCVLEFPVPKGYIKPLINIWLDDLHKRNTVAFKAISFDVQSIIERYIYSILLSNTNKKTNKSFFSVKKQKIIITILSYIVNNLESNISVQNLSNIIGNHPNYIQRVFSDFMGVSIHQFIVRTKLRYASVLLKETDLSVLNISLDAGFGSLSQFYKTFNDFFNISPASYRKKYRKT